MIGFFRELRLLPIAIVASACLLALIAADLLLDRAATTADGASGALAEATVIHAAPGVTRPSERPQSWAQQMFNYPDAAGTPPPSNTLARLPALRSLAQDTSQDKTQDKGNAEIITGSVSGSEDKSETKAKGEAAGPIGKDAKPIAIAPPSGASAPPLGAPAPSPAERAILERLAERRQELDKRARELDIREGLIADAEKRIESRLTEIKAAEAQLVTATDKKDEAEAARFKGLVTMYENMKPRDAAKIFDRLEIGVLLEVSSQINPRRMADILALMSADTAQRLTVELASRAQGAGKGGAADLPKIDGRPTSQ
jgi:flagellar motility protein MotE (MotC chaperone)